MAYRFLGSLFRSWHYFSFPWIDYWNVFQQSLNQSDSCLQWIYCAKVPVPIEVNCNTLWNSDFFCKIWPFYFHLPFFSFYMDTPGSKHRKKDLKLIEVVDLVLLPLYPSHRVHSTVVLNKHLLKLNETGVNHKWRAVAVFECLFIKHLLIPLMKETLITWSRKKVWD